MFNSLTYNSLEFNMAGVSTVVIVGPPIFLDQDDEIIVLDVNAATLTLGNDEDTGLLL